jgi:hypothetical protein
VTALVLGATVLAAAILTWLHLRPDGSRRAEEVPSLQHLPGPSPRRRRIPPLEERLAWALRVASLALALLGLWTSRGGWGADARPLVVVEPDARAAVQERAGLVAAGGPWLGFEGERPTVHGNLDPRLAAALEACSDTRVACLLRAADDSGRDLVLIGAFSGAAWRPALARRARPFSYLRVDSPISLPSAPERRTTGTVDVVLEGQSVAARIWAAALATAAEAPRPGAGGEGALRREILLVDSGRPSKARPGAALTVVAVDRPGAAGPDHPGVELRPSTGLVLPDPLDLAAGTPGLGAQLSLRFLADERFSQLLPVAALRRAPGGAVLALVATPEDLGSWAHQGVLVPLARALLAAALPPPAEVDSSPAGGSIVWRGPDGQVAPVGILDVHPGRYRRGDGRIALELTRERIPGTDPLDDAALERLGGRPWMGDRHGRFPWASSLFGAALATWLAGVWLTRRLRRAWLPAAAVAALLALFTLDARWPTQVAARWMAVLASPPGPPTRQLEAALASSGVSGLPPGDDSAGACLRPGAASPCVQVATLGFASAPPPAANALVFDAERPRVDLLRVDAPREISLGAAAEVWATVRVRRAEGQSVTVTARSTSAAPATAELGIDGPDVVRTVRLPVSPIAEGVAFLAVEASIASEPQARDGRMLALATRGRPPRRMVLAGAPGWEARAAADALASGGAQVSVLSLLGTSAVVARGQVAEDPRQLLAHPERLDGVDLLALVGFSTHALDARAAAGLRQFIDAGGAALVLDSPGVAAALGVALDSVPAASSLRPLLGRLGADGAMAFQGYPPPPGLELTPGLTVLGHLGAPGDPAPAPWVVGRALGKGRLAVVTAPDLWRLSPPGVGRSAYLHAFLPLMGWLEAARASRGSMVLSDDWSVLRVADGDGTRDVPLPTSSPVAGLTVDAVDLPAFIRSPRARLRAEAARSRHPFLEPDGADALAATLRRLPPPASWVAAVPMRKSDAAWCLLVGLLALEALARRAYRGTGESGSRARTSPSSEDTGGSVTGDGRSQRASAAPASRAEVVRDPGSFAA